VFVLIRIPRDPLASRCALFAGSTATAHHPDGPLTWSLSVFQVRPRSPLPNRPLRVAAYTTLLSRGSVAVEMTSDATMPVSAGRHVFPLLTVFAIPSVVLA
jgi:hypothetical protein